MTKTVVIHQPDFLSYLGFFHRLLYADLFVLLDNAQYVKSTSQSWTNRDKIKTAQGVRWLTMSVRKASRETSINEIRLSSDVDWRTRNLNQIMESYKIAPFYAEIFPYIEQLYSFDCEKLLNFNLRSIEMLMNLFDIHVPITMAGELDVTGKKNELLINILRKVQATCYLSGTGARVYTEPGLFEKAGIELKWQEFRHPFYQQLHGPFIPMLSSIDLLFNCGIEQSRYILRNC